MREPAEWGVIFALRTGPSALNKELVVYAHSLGMKVAGGRLWRVDMDDARWRRKCRARVSEFLKRAAADTSIDQVPCPTEEAFFEALGLPYWAPPSRTVATIGRWRTLPPRTRERWRLSAQLGWQEYNSQKEAHGRTALQTLTDRSS